MWGCSGSCRGGVGLNVNLFFPIHIQPFTNDSNLRNNNLYEFENSQMDMAGCV